MKKWKINDIISFKFSRLEQDFFNYEIRKIVKGELPKSDVFNCILRKPRYGVMDLSFEESSKKFMLQPGMEFMNVILIIFKIIFNRIYIFFF
mgnify:CR=1 FL=1